MTVRHERRISRAETALCLFVLALAAALRLYRLDLIDVRFDEASALQLALGIARGNWLPVAPFSGSVANHPPVYLYVLALPYLFTRDFLAIAAYRAALDVLAIGLCWWLCRRFFNVRVAFMACLFFAVAPWAIQFARKTWLAPLPVFFVVLLFGLLEAVQHKNPWGWAVAGLGLALSLGAHLSAVYLVPVVVLAAAIGWRTLRPLPVLMGLLPLAALAVLYLGFDAQQGFANVRGLFTTAGATAQFSDDALRLALWSSGGAHLSDLTSSAFGVWQAQVPPLLDAIDTLQIVVLATSAIGLLALVIARRSAITPTIVVLVLWMALPVILQLRHSRPLQIHYFVPLYPVPFVLMALGLDALPRVPRGRAGRIFLAWAAASIVAIIAGWQVFVTQRFTQFIQQYDTSNGGYGPPIRSALDVAQVAREAIRAGRATDVIVAAPGGDPAVNEPATIFDVLLADVPHRFVNADAGLILREDATQYIFVAGTDRARSALMTNIDHASAITQSVPVRAGHPLAYEYVFVPAAKLVAVREQPAQWENGVGLLGYRAPLSNPFEVALIARVFREAAPGTNTHWFAQVFRADGKVAQQDTSGVPPSNWRVGDILLVWFDVPVAGGIQPTDRIRVGTYWYPAVQNVNLLDSAGNPAGQFVELSPEASP